jgi:GR25 family glycosyltransferase involved in LPS biosynthesis
MLPSTWEDVVKAKAYMISLEKYRFRGEYSKGLLEHVGFSNIEIIDGWDSCSDTRKTDAMMKSLGIHQNLSYGHKGCTLSHILMWKRIVDENIPYCIIFEDDVIPHKKLAEGLGEEYWSKTPKNFDILYLGNMIQDNEILDPQKKITQSITYCLHAYMLTLEGARKIMSSLQEFMNMRGFINMNDIHLVELQVAKKIKHYCWNGKHIPKTDPTFDPQLPWQFFPSVILPKKDTGLFYQNYRLGSSVTPDGNLVLGDLNY